MGGYQITTLLKQSNTSADADSSDYCLVGFRLEDTVSEHGSVARGICSADSDAFLTELAETLNIRRSENNILSDAGPLTGDETASMNLWGFTPSLFKHLEIGFQQFLEKNIDETKAEYFLPEVVGELITKELATVKVLEANSQWLGMTYREDKPIVIGAIQKMIDNGIYPEKLWD